MDGGSMTLPSRTRPTPFESFVGVPSPRQPLAKGAREPLLVGTPALALESLNTMAATRYDRLVLALSVVLHAGPSSRVARPIRGGILKRVGLAHESSFQWGAMGGSSSQEGEQGSGARLQGQLLDVGPSDCDLLEARDAHCSTWHLTNMRLACLVCVGDRNLVPPTSLSNPEVSTRRTRRPSTTR